MPERGKRPKVSCQGLELSGLEKCDQCSPKQDSLGDRLRASDVSQLECYCHSELFTQISAHYHPQSVVSGQHFSLASGSYSVQLCCPQREVGDCGASLCISFLCWLCEAAV